MVDRENFNAPIPGQSLTSNPENNVWQRPPQYPTVEEAVNYYMQLLLNEDYTSDLLDVIEMKIPLTAIANSLQLGSVMTGKHTVDVGLLCLPVIIEILITMAELSNVDYFIGTEDEKFKVQLSDVRKAKIARKLDMDIKEEIKNSLSLDSSSDFVEEQVDDTDQEEMSADNTLPGGLMARRI
jgi:hypothetical protein